MGSTRFPGKPLALINGREMILHTLERARLANCFDRIICATDSQQILTCVKRAGFDAVFTGEHPTGSDRVAEVAVLMRLPLVVNLQGDEPVVSLDLLRQVSNDISLDPSSWVTASSPLNLSELSNPNVVKVRVVDGVARQFSRGTVQGAEWFTHRGIYAYSLEALEEFSQLARTVQEREQSLEQLRVMGRRDICVTHTLEQSLSVDVPSDIAAVEAFLLRSNP